MLSFESDDMVFQVCSAARLLLEQAVEFQVFNMKEVFDVIHFGTISTKLFDSSRKTVVHKTKRLDSSLNRFLSYF